jgi:hypothetical protein
MKVNSPSGTAAGVPTPGRVFIRRERPFNRKNYFLRGMPYALIIVTITSKPFRKKRDQKSID